MTLTKKRNFGATDNLFVSSNSIPPCRSEDHQANMLSTAESLPPLQTLRGLLLDLRNQCLPRIEAG